MTDRAEVTMVLYRDLLTDEERVLKGLENDLISVLLENHATFHPFWTSRTDARGRFVRLCVFDNKNTVLLEWPSRQIALLSPNELRARLEERLRQH
jgi:hypothetical protein